MVIGGVHGVYDSRVKINKVKYTRCLVVVDHLQDFMRTRQKRLYSKRPTIYTLMPHDSKHGWKSTMKHYQLTTLLGTAAGQSSAEARTSTKRTKSAGSGDSLGDGRVGLEGRGCRYSVGHALGQAERSRHSRCCYYQLRRKGSGKEGCLLQVFKLRDKVLQQQKKDLKRFGFGI